MMNINLFALLFLPWMLTSFLACSSAQSLLENVKSAATTAYQVAAPAATATTSFVCNSVIPFIRHQLSNNQHPGQLYIAYDDTNKKTCRVKSQSDSESNSEAESIDSEHEFEMIDSYSTQNCSRKKSKNKQTFFATVQELDANVEKNAGATLHTIHQTIHSYYQHEDPANLAVQKKILHLTNLLQQSAKKVALQPVIADEYNPIQLQILNDKIQTARKKIPVLDEEHQTVMKKATLDFKRRVEKAQKQFDVEKKIADERYEKHFTKLHISTFIAAQISAELNTCSESTKTSHPAHDFNNFTTKETYKNFLANVQEPLTSQAIIPGAEQRKKK
jgi:hypothetical protein